MHGRIRPFFIIFDLFHINRVTAVFCHIVTECKRSDTVFSHRIRSFSAAYDTAKYGRNTLHMKRVKYGPFTVINDSVRDGFQRIRSPYLSTWDYMFFTSCDWIYCQNSSNFSIISIEFVIKVVGWTVE